jgi:hypothetical protein
MDLPIIIPLAHSPQPSLAQSILSSPVVGAVAGFSLGFLSSLFIENRRRRFELKRDSYIELLEVSNNGYNLNSIVRSGLAQNRDQLIAENRNRFEIAKIKVKIFGSGSFWSAIESWDYNKVVDNYDNFKDILMSKIEEEIPGGKLEKSLEKILRAR